MTALQSSGTEWAGDNLEQFTTVTRKLLAYCQKHDWAGYDPYDALNSRIFQALPFLHFRAARLVLTQFLKRCPINLRPPLLVPRIHNPKGLALFISACIRLSKLGLAPAQVDVGELISKLVTLRSKGYQNWCWGYPFPWQARAALFPRWLPNVICTTFAGNALLDAYDEFREKDYLKMAASAADFIRQSLYFEDGDSAACFSYTPLVRSKVHNANLLGAAFLCRVAKAAGEPKYLPPALKAARFSVAHQCSDGSWDYGESDDPPQRWRDNFHSGYNLCALRCIAQNAATDEFETAIRMGVAFYRRSFFGENAVPKYFHNRTYPIDIHSAAQSIITLICFKDLHPGNVPLAYSVWRWTLQHLWDERGFFYFQKHPFYTNKIPYMRWSQAWMLAALSTIVREGLQTTKDDPGEKYGRDQRGGGTAAGK
jgi:hypothetical protein